MYAILAKYDRYINTAKMLRVKITKHYIYFKKYIFLNIKRIKNDLEIL